MQPSETGVDVPSSLAVIAALVVALAASWYAWRFSRTVGGEMGAAFKWVMIGVIVFAVTRVDDVLKMSGVYSHLGVHYQRLLWLPHSLVVLLAWVLIALGFRRMLRAFQV